ncbi:unnamed protein product, partial [Rotaria sp. Silwood2]
MNTIVRLPFIDDFGNTVRQTFQALSILCQLVEQTFFNILVDLYSMNYVSAYATPAYLLQSQSEAVVQQFISSTTSNFLLSLRLILDTAQANALLSALMTNFILFRISETTVLGSYWRTYDDGCACASSKKCVTHSCIYENNDRSLSWSVP